MFICLECEQTFSEGKTMYELHPYGMGYADEKYWVCPHCNSSQIDEAKKCEHCGEWVAELHDGLCDVCYEDMYGE